MFTCLELFAGCGGLALGLERAGFTHIGFNDNNKWACKSLRANFPNIPVFEMGIEEFVDQNLCEVLNIKTGDLDLISGGPPCQSFSYAGNRAGIDDVRGTMFFYYALCLEQLKPKMFVFENVKGLLSHDKGKTFTIIKDILADCGYNIYYKILNANDHLVAQNRYRIFIVGVRKDLTVSFNFPEPALPKYSLDWVLNEDLHDSVGAKYSKRKQELFAMLQPGQYWKHLPENVAKEYMGSMYYNKGGSTGCLRRLSKHEPCLTILTSPQGKMTERCHPDFERPLNIAETKAVQSFPKEYIVVGSVSEQYRQLGNAVPPNLAKALGDKIVMCLSQTK